MLDSNPPANFSSATFKRAMPQETKAIELQTMQPTSTFNTTSTHPRRRDNSADSEAAIESATEPGHPCYHAIKRHHMSDKYQFWLNDRFNPTYRS